MFWLDWVAIAFIVVHLALGYLQGFVQGLLSLVGFALGLVLVLWGAPWLAAQLGPHLPWPPVLTLVLSAVVLLMTLRLVVGYVTARARAPVDASPRARRVDHMLGLLPGAVWGVGSAALVIWLYSALWGTPPAEAAVANRIQGWSRVPLSAIAERVPASMPGIAVFPDGVAIVPGPSEAERAAPASAQEQRMLALVNGERKKHGLKTLVWDGRLAEVARAHSRDMLARNYFAHESPEGATVADRVRRRGIFYLVVGENLALAPSLNVAHEGLMRSPGHRENILRPAFGHVGIGIVRVPPGADYRPKVAGHGATAPLRSTEGYLIVTQVFKN